MDTWLMIVGGLVAVWILRNQYLIMRALKGKAAERKRLDEMTVSELMSP